MTLDALDGRIFASTTEVAQLLDGADPRTVRRMCEAGDIPSIRVGGHYKIPVAWLREHLGAVPAPEPVSAPVDLDQLADRVADRVFARFAGLFAALAPDATAAGPAPPGPAATATDPPPATGRSHTQDKAPGLMRA